MIAPPPPPPVFQLPRGTKLMAGLGTAEVLPDMDFETFSPAGFIWDEVKGRWEAPPGVADNQKGLKAVGTVAYTEHPNADVLTFSFDLKDGRGIERWRPGMENPQRLFDYLATGGLIESHNCAFEFWVWTSICTPRYGWPPLNSQQQRCSMAKARAHGLPGGLDAIGNVIGTDFPKDAAGKDLMKLFTVPQKPTRAQPKKRITFADEPVQGERFSRYCDRDIQAEADISARIPDLSPMELEWWQIDQAINRRGVQVDLGSVRAGINVIEQAFARYNTELAEITGGTVQRASELQKLKGWLGAQGVHVGSMDEDGIAEVMKERARFPPAAVRALEIRQAIGSGSVKKLYAMLNQASRAGRLHELFSYHAARTGRTTGNGPQPTNLPNSGPDMNRCTCGRHYGLRKPACPWCGAIKAPPPPGGKSRSVVEWCAQAAADAIEVMDSGSLDRMQQFFDDAVWIVSACLRGMFIAAPGHDLICSDYTAIEAVVLAELSGEQWRIDLFRANGKIYEASGAKIYGITYDEAIAYADRTGTHHPCRKTGKVAELAGGYQGWIGAYKQFGADEFMSDEEIKTAILAWRAASPMIVKFWGGQHVDEQGMPCPSFFRGARPELTGLEGMAIAAVMNPGRRFDYHGIAYFMYGDVLYCELLSGRRLAYHRPRLRPGDRSPLALSYEGWNTNPKNGPVGWIRMDTYGGKLTENVVQATARDILVFAIVNLWRAGYPCVLHVYDEIVSEVPQGWGSIEEFERVMGDLPPWAAGWPVRAAGGWRGPRYRK